MSIFDWFRRRRGPKVVGESKGGSQLLKYGSKKRKPRLGFLEESTLPFIEERERIYDDLFGECDSVFHELLPLIPHIDVYRYPPSKDRDFFTYVTGGMSDLAMQTPSGVGLKWSRTELVFYASSDHDKYSGFLQALAHFPHDNDTWLHWGHSMPNGTPPLPLFDCAQLNTIFFAPTIVTTDAQLGERLIIDSCPVHLLWCIPITESECQLKLDHGSSALYDLFNEKSHPFVFSGGRQSYV